VNPVNFGIGIGMFTAIGTGAVVKNLNFDNATVAANPNATGPGQFVGVLAGTNAGTVTNVNVNSGTVSAATGLHGVIAGGLIGQNGDVGQNQMGTIVNSSSAANVTVPSAASGSSNNIAGGLVGSNPAVGNNLATITDSFATGTVSGGAILVRRRAGWNNNGAINGLSSTASPSRPATSASRMGPGRRRRARRLQFRRDQQFVRIRQCHGGNSSDIFHAGSIGGWSASTRAARSPADSPR
jgi:hypothetical protein